jgi:hypothetical protein
MSAIESPLRRLARHRCSTLTIGYTMRRCTETLGICKALSCRPAEPDGWLLFADLIDLLDGVIAPLDDLPGPAAAGTAGRADVRGADRVVARTQAVGVALVTLVRRLPGQCTGGHRCRRRPMAGPRERCPT